MSAQFSKDWQPEWGAAVDSIKIRVPTDDEINAGFPASPLATSLGDWVTGGVCKIEPGIEFECDRAKVTEDKVLVRKNGIWIELQPTNSACLK
jgi:hypothetical protein